MNTSSLGSTGDGRDHGARPPARPVDTRVHHERAADPTPSGSQADDAHVDRADRLQERLALPVLLAALASVPAVFLTLLDDPARTAGTVLNTLSGAVLIAETVVLVAVSDHRLAWIRRNWWLIALAVVMIPAIVLAVGPVQLLRLLQVMRFVGAIRIIRVGRILKAGRIVRERAGLDRMWQRVIGAAVSLLVAAFVAVVLTDPSSYTRQVLDGAVDRVGVLGVLLAGLVLGVATYIVRTARDDEAEDDADEG